MCQRPPRFTRTYTRFPYTTLFRADKQSGRTLAHSDMVEAGRSAGALSTGLSSRGGPGSAFHDSRRRFPHHQCRTISARRAGAAVGSAHSHFSEAELCGGTSTFFSHDWMAVHKPVAYRRVRPGGNGGGGSVRRNETTREPQ